MLDRKRIFLTTVIIATLACMALWAAVIKAMAV